jgi:osmotically inducible protein OsmC
MNRNASVVWKGTLREGSGTMTTESGVLSDTRYSFHTRFAHGIGTNPDELIAASLGGCFSMFLANELGLSGFHPQRIETTATATLDDLAAGWTLTHIQLDVRADVPDASQACFMDAALAAKTKCPVARLLKTNISMTASLTNDLRRVQKTNEANVRRRPVNERNRRGAPANLSNFERQNENIKVRGRVR